MSRGSPQTRGKPREVPDVADRGGPARCGTMRSRAPCCASPRRRSALADDALKRTRLCLAAGTSSPSSVEIFSAEQAVLLGSQGTVVDRLGLLPRRATGCAHPRRWRARCAGRPKCSRQFRRHLSLLSLTDPGPVRIVAIAHQLSPQLGGNAVERIGRVVFFRSCARRADGLVQRAIAVFLAVDVPGHVDRAMIVASSSTFRHSDFPSREPRSSQAPRGRGCSRP